MRTYFSYREKLINGALQALEVHLDHSFGDLVFTYEVAISDGISDGDGRKVGYIDADAQDKIDAILRTFHNDTETTVWVKDKVNLWDNRTGVDLATEDGSIVTIPQEEAP